MPNCVGYALGRFNEIGGHDKFKYVIGGNAENFYDNAQKLGLKVGQTPKLGAIMVWQGGNSKTTSSDGCGHVVVVEQIISDTEIVDSESGWNAKKLFWTQRRSKGNGNWGMGNSYKFLGFVYNPDVPEEAKSTCPYATPVITLKKGQKSNGVKWLQWHLNANGAHLAVDGSFGPSTETALKQYQTNHGLVADGLCGPKTRKALLA